MQTPPADHRDAAEWDILRVLTTKLTFALLRDKLHSVPQTLVFSLILSAFMHDQSLKVLVMVTVTMIPQTNAVAAMPGMMTAVVWPTK